MTGTATAGGEEVEAHVTVVSTDFPFKSPTFSASSTHFKPPETTRTELSMTEY